MAPSRAPQLPTAAVAAVVALSALPIALAHGGGELASHEGSGGHNGSSMVQQPDFAAYPPTYFAHDEHVSLIYAHIALMVIAWVLVLPVAVMFSLVSSRYTLSLQFAFLATNVGGVLLGAAYNAQTPDLYPGNAHHSIGWIATWVVSAQVLVGLVGRVARRFGVSGGREAADSSGDYSPVGHHRFVPVPTMGGGERLSSLAHDCRLSDDSGHGTESACTESVRSNSVSTAYDEDAMPSPYKEFADEGESEDEEGRRGFEAMPPTNAPRQPATGWTRSATAVVSWRVWRYIKLGYKVIDRVILPFGFITLATGIITYARFFEGINIFGGLAHWIKGGVFFWLGLFNLGRWSGSFAELGWAWNARPRRSGQGWRPSAEFVESALIFFYGSTNIFLEHLGGWGGEWTGQDLEHISITVLFLGGGLCGMLIESNRIRKLLNTNIESRGELPYSPEDGREALEASGHPDTYEFSINPIPALVILLLGIMMSSHQQTSMIASMVHSQWGNLLTGASVARFLTYVVVFLRPPTSVFPSRPPTELLASFGLIAGGIIFMASSSDTVDGMIHYGLDAMFIYTVTMGLVGLLMAWEIAVLALKGWAWRQEHRY